MSNASIERLLEPSLGGHEPPALAPFSTTALFVTGFVGGPLGLLFCFTANVHRLRRWRQDAVFLALMTVVLLTAAWLPLMPVGKPLYALITSVLGSGSLSVWGSLCTALGSLAAMHRHARERRAAELSGLKVKDGFVHCLAMVVVAIGLSFLLAKLMKGFI